MAVAGLQNVSAFGPSFFGESQSSVSTGWDDEPGSRSTRASSILQMWRELEGDGVVNNSRSPRQQRDVSDSECLSTSISMGQGSDNCRDVSEDSAETDIEVEHVAGSEMEHEDINSILSEQSSDLGEIERDRVRQIFQEWMNCGSACHSPNNRSWPQWLGENERERVRSIREWVQMNAQQRNNQESVRDGVSEAGVPIEQVRDGLVVTHPEIGARRPIRRLCGRQTLLDLLQRAQCERRGELQNLSELRPVSDFAHRNRIQALLRGRFLRNERLIPDKRPSSVAATELRYLRQRNTVSGLREEFLTKLENSASPSVSGAEADPPFCDTNNLCRESDLTEVRLSDLENTVDAERSHNYLGMPVDEVNDPNLQNDGNEQNMMVGINRSQQAVSLDAGTTCSGEECVLHNETTERELSDNSQSVNSGHGEEINTSISNEMALGSEYTNGDGSHIALHENYELMSDESNFHEVASHTVDLAGDTDQQLDPQDASALVDESRESVVVTGDNSWQQLTRVAFTRSTNDRREEVDRNWEEASDNQLFQNTSYNDVVEQESPEDWPGHDFQEAIDSWLDIPSAEVGESNSRTRSYYFSDDDNTQSMELRELFSRRRVSSLLRSSFRESLDQVLQSHVERQSHVLENWETDNTSTPSLVEQDQGRLNDIHAFPLSNAVDDNPFVPTSTFITAFQPLWDDELLNANLLRNSSDQQLGMEWDVINELRIDMAQLQHRLNKMQSMLEACINMQIELQRSVRQEVSAALNRSIQKTCGVLTDADASKGNNLDETTRWDHVRRGICCVCCESNIDTLLYRCGHLCTCTNCAENLVQSQGKCPMCQAPVVEAVRAYFTH